MKHIIKYEFNNREYPIKFGYYEAFEIFPEQFEIDLAEIFTDEEKAMVTMSNLALNDKATLKLMNYFVDDIEWEQLIKKAEASDLDRFREDFWTAVGVFSGPLKKGILDQLWRQFKKDLKDTDFQELMSTQSHSDSNPEEST